MLNCVGIASKSVAKNRNNLSSELEKLLERKTCVRTLGHLFQLQIKNLIISFDVDYPRSKEDPLDEFFGINAHSIR